MKISQTLYTLLLHLVPVRELHYINGADTLPAPLDPQQERQALDALNHGSTEARDVSHRSVNSSTSTTDSTAKSSKAMTNHSESTIPTPPFSPMLCPVKSACADFSSLFARAFHSPY